MTRPIRIFSIVLLVMVLVSSFAVFSFAKDEFEVLSAKQVGEYDVLIEFSQPVEFNYFGMDNNREDGPFICIAETDEYYNVTHEYNGILRFADNTHKKIVFTLADIISPYTSISDWYSGIIAANGHLCVSIEERGDEPDMKNDGYIDNITIEGTPNKLPSKTQVGGYDAVVIELVQDFSITLDENLFENIMTSKTHGKVSVKTVYVPSETETETETETQTENESEEDIQKDNPKNGDITSYVLAIGIVSLIGIAATVAGKKEGETK